MEAIELIGLFALAALFAWPAAASDTMLIDFSDDSERGRWVAVNDGVMGGVSRGGMTIEDGVGVFAGSVSFENNGGFSSVWRRPGEPELGEELGGAEGLRLRVRGDGKAYRVRLRTPELREDVSYQLEVRTTAGEWTEHDLPFARFEPRFRGRTVGAPPLEPSRIRGFGLLVAPEEAGPFRLEVAWVKGYGGGAEAGE